MGTAGAVASIADGAIVKIDSRFWYGREKSEELNTMRAVR
jgi:hypothetical protein